tara:strand:- start:24 stop:569 length:546 start_codon:yes stop_codon:yes gene_type:complete
MAAQKSSIEFLPQDTWEKGTLGKILKWALTVGRHIVILTELIVILAFLSRFKFDRDLTDLNDEVKQKKVVIEASAQFEKDFRFLQTQLAAIKALNDQQLQTDQVLADLASLTPIDIIFSDLQVSEEEITVTASALSESGLATFLRNLKASSEFGQLTLSQVKSDVEKQVGTTFSLKAKHGS